MTNTQSTSRPATDTTVKPVHPGSLLKRQLDSHGFNINDVAILIGCSKVTLDAIVAGQSSVTEEIAKGLEMVLGISATMWLNLQKAYDEAVKSK